MKCLVNEVIRNGERFYFKIFDSSRFDKYAKEHIASQTEWRINDIKKNYHKNCKDSTWLFNRCNGLMHRCRDIYNEYKIEEAVSLRDSVVALAKYHNVDITCTSWEAE